MEKQAISLGIFILKQIIEHEPEIAAEIKDLLTKAEPTEADWDALDAKLHAKTYRDYVPSTKLPQAPVSPLPAGHVEQVAIMPSAPSGAPQPPTPAANAAPAPTAPPPVAPEPTTAPAPTTAVTPAPAGLAGNVVRVQTIGA